MSSTSSVLGVERARFRQISSIALPIIGGMVSQNVLNLVDTLMVGRLGPDALSAVGFGGFANFMAGALVIGMSAGVQAVAARRKGEGRISEMAVPLNGGLILVAAIAIPLSAVLFLMAPAIFPILSRDASVVAIGVPYLQARLCAMIAVGSNYAFRGYWNGVSLSRLYLRTLIVMHVCNVVLNFLLIFGMLGFPRLGATGAGIGTAIATFIGTGYYFYLGRKHAGHAGFLASVPSLQTLKSIFRLSIPSGIQSLFYAAGLTALFSIIDAIGTDEVAAANVLINITLVAYLPGLGLGLAAASLVGQALGRRDPDDAERWGWDVVKIGAALMFVLGLPMLIAPRLLLGPFFPNDPQALELAVLPLRLAGATIGVEAVAFVLLNACMGAGATKLSMVLSVGMQWLLFLPMAFLIGPHLGYGLLGVWITRITYRAIMAALFASIWKSRRWANVEV